MQIASEKKVFVIDLIKLFADVPDVLDDCLTRILQSPRILKLGMRNCNTIGELELSLRRTYMK